MACETGVIGACPTRPSTIRQLPPIGSYASLMTTRSKVIRAVDQDCSAGPRDLRRAFVPELHPAVSVLLRTSRKENDREDDQDEY
jgi:hypothetical protein